MSNHYIQKANDFFLGGLPSLMLNNYGVGTHYTVFFNLSFGVYALNPFPFSTTVSIGNLNSLSASLLPPVPIGNNRFNFDIGGTIKKGSLEPKDSVLYENRTINSDYGAGCHVALEYHYADYITGKVGCALEHDYIHSSGSKFTLLNFYYDSVINTLRDEKLGFKGVRFETLFRSGLENYDDVIWDGRLSLKQRFELKRDACAVGYELQTAFMHFPYELTSGYANYGGFDGMPGYPYGTFKRNLIIMGISYQQRLMELQGMPLIAVAQVKIGIKDSYNLYTDVGEPDSRLFDSFNVFQNDLGYALYLALQTPIGNLTLGGGASITSNKYAVFIGLM
jgi:hypothetical protein